MVAGPYSRENKQRPMYVDEIRCNWTGHNVDELGYYVCKVNTTDAKHTDLASRTGVRQLPRNYTWNTVINTMPLPAQNVIKNWCNDRGIPYDATETLGELLMRIINSGLFSLGSTALTTQYQNLTQLQKDKITAICQRTGIAVPEATETVRSITNRAGRVTWPGDDSSKVWVDEF
jgi:hypothetical protein